MLDAANRCARALGSSLEIEEAFAAFIRELRGLVPFDRTAIVLADEGAAAGDRRCRGGRGDGLSSRLAAAGRRLVARRDSEDRPDGVPKGHDRPAICRGGGVHRARAALPSGRSSRRRCTDGRDALARPCRAGRLHRGRGRARFVARPISGERGPEHPGLRGGARDGRGAAPALRVARGLRLDGLPRDAEPDGLGDRLCEDAPRALAGAHSRAARVVPRPDRARDEPAGRPRRRRARHLTHRVGELQLSDSPRSTSASSSRNRRLPPRAARTR